MQPLIRSLLLWLALPLAAAALAISPDKLTLNAPVIDEARLLSAQESAAISRQIRQWHSQNLMQAAVVIVPSTDGMEPFDYALNIFDRWQLGSKKDDNGLLFLIASSDRKFFIMTGRGLEGALPDVSIARIERTELVPAFKAGNYAQGINRTLSALAGQLQADEESRQRMIDADKKAASGQTDDISDKLPFFIFFFAGGFLILGIFGRIIGTVVNAGLASAFAIFLLQFAAPVGIILGIAAAIAVLILSFGSKGGGPIIISNGGFGGGGFGGGGFGGGGFGGGGGSSAGGGAGGSW